MAAVKTLLFDVGGVLLTNGWDHVERAAVLDHFGVDRTEYEQRHELPNDAWEKGLITVEEFLEQTVFFQPRSFTMAQFVAAMKEQSQLLPSGAIKLLPGIRDSGIRLAILNNEARELNDYRIERFALRESFEVFFSSCYLGLRKPDPRIFQLALDLLQTSPGEVTFVDDRPGNCAAAGSMGMQAIHYQDATQFAQELSRLGVLAGNANESANRRSSPASQH